MRQQEQETEEGYVQVQSGDVTLEGNLIIPDGAPGLVLFAHGSGSSRFSPRNRAVAQTLREEAGIGTLLFDLLTSEEDEIDRRTRELRFDITLLAERLVGATDWVLEQEETRELNLGYFGSSTGAAAALIGATRRPGKISAVVSRGGRGDLAGDALPEVEPPTQMIVGGRDTPVIRMNKEAMAQMEAQVELEIIEGATHLFEEPGALEEVASLAAGWFKKHLSG
jgi:pimeloyl-ACP methyl ester carboxylesterase